MAVIILYSVNLIACITLGTAPNKTCSDTAACKIDIIPVSEHDGKVHLRR